LTATVTSLPLLYAWMPKLTPVTGAPAFTDTAALVALGTVAPPARMPAPVVPVTVPVVMTVTAPVAEYAWMPLVWPVPGAALTDRERLLLLARMAVSVADLVVSVEMIVIAPAPVAVALIPAVFPEMSPAEVIEVKPSAAEVSTPTPVLAVTPPVPTPS